MSDEDTSGMEELIHSNGEAHCPNKECDWWVPEGMEYTFTSHDCETYGSKDIPVEEILEIAREDQDENDE